MLELENIVSIHKTKLYDKGYDILFNDGRIIWVIKRRAIVGLLLLIKYEICSEEDLTGTNDRLQTIKRILKNKIPSDWIQERYGDANKPFSELWTEEGFSCVRAEGLSGNRKYVLSKNDHELLFNVNVKNTRISIGKLDKEIILKQQGYLCNICGALLREVILPKTFAKDRVKIEIDHRIPIDKGGQNSISNYQALCHYCNKCKRQICFICLEKCDDTCALVFPERQKIIKPTNENISDRITKNNKK
ncbi:HNH endonuclease [Helicobacter pylori]|uniref:HNH endonuclease n=1 Tax=Helicobacter pylori TaxID=210 RepID=UPI000682201C|nr:HNH endonuclease signature motif containing protein [Helicobacter pylori]